VYFVLYVFSDLLLQLILPTVFCCIEDWPEWGYLAILFLLSSTYTWQPALMTEAVMSESCVRLWPRYVRRN